MADLRPDLPVVRLKPKAHQRALRGHPWIYSNEVEMDAPTKAIAPGELVRVVSAGGETIDHGWFNPHTLISVRRLETGAEAPDAGFFERRLRAAAAIRAAAFSEPWYRWVHAEADGLPGVVIDRYGEVVVVQANGAGADRSLDALAAAIRAVAPEVRTIVARNDASSRLHEGLDQAVTVLHGVLDGPVLVRENGADYFGDLAEGQKTGWFYDHRANRALVRRFAEGRRVLDVYAYAGAFTIQAALGGASEVLSVDRSERALDLARRAAEANGVADRITFQRADVFNLLESIEPRSVDLVIADPPAFAKSRKDLPQAERGYRKLARLAGRAVAPGGKLFIASCSHAMETAAFQAETARGLSEAGRTARILARTGADLDHPEHPFLPESAYLKGLLYVVV